MFSANAIAFLLIVFYRHKITRHLIVKGVPSGYKRCRSC